MALPYMVEAYVDNYIALIIPTSQEQLRHVANGVMMGVHDVFPADAVDAEDPLSLKKITKFESMWALHEDVLGFTFDGVEKNIWLETPKCDTILTTLHTWLQIRFQTVNA